MRTNRRTCAALKARVRSLQLPAVLAVPSKNSSVGSPPAAELMRLVGMRAQPLLHATSASPPSPASFSPSPSMSPSLHEPVGCVSTNLHHTCAINKIASGANVLHLGPTGVLQDYYDSTRLRVHRCSCDASN